MSNQVVRILLATILFSPAARTADIQGTILVERPLTKRNVTPSAALYQRGSAVPLGLDATQDPLAYERTHVVIYVEQTADRLPVAPTTPSQTVPTIEQRDRRFVPDLIVIPAGSVVSFPNFDPVFHNVFSLSKPKSFDLGNYANGQTKTVKFMQSGVVLVFCHLHPNMAASIVVTPNEWSAVADPSGKFTIRGVPPGKYVVAAWHKSAGVFRQTVEVTDRGAVPIKFFIPLKAEPTSQTNTSQTNQDPMPGHATAHR